MKASLSHYHICGHDKFQLAHWYEAKLGFRVVKDVEALGEQGGPLFISADGGKTGIAVFSKPDADKESFALKCIPAFEVTPEEFVEFYRKEKAANSELVIYDHHISCSIYLMDPVGTKVEIVSHRYAEVSGLLEKAGVVVKKMNPTHDSKYRDMKS